MGYKHSPETVEKMRHIFSNRSAETRAKISASNKGRKRSEESKRRQSETTKGRTPSEKTMIALRKAIIAGHTPEATAKRVATRKAANGGNWHSPETIEKIRANAIARHQVKNQLTLL